MKKLVPLTSVCLLLLAQASSGWDSSILYKDGNGRLVYESDENGNRVADFSHAGYHSGADALPNYPVVHTITPVVGDDTASIQAAINAVAALPVQNRGAILLTKGTYDVSGIVYINADGIVLRGEGNGNTANDTIVIGTGTDPRKEQGIILVQSSSSGYEVESGTLQNVISEFLPIGSRTVEVENGAMYSVGDDLVIRHDPTEAWLEAINYGNVDGDENVWVPGQNDLKMYFHGTVTAISGNKVKLDTPLYHPLDRSLSQSVIYRQGGSGPVEECGVENMRVISQNTGGTNEGHRWDCVHFIGARNCWAENVISEGFAESGFRFTKTMRSTVLSCQAIDPVSQISGGRRYNFYVGEYSHDVLVKNSLATKGRHCFVGNGAASVSGAVFSQCESRNAYASSENHRRWGSGFLWDDIQWNSASAGTVLALYNRGNWGTSHGWTGTGLVAWNISAPGKGIICSEPPVGQNFAIGCDAAISGYNYPVGHVEGTGQTLSIPSLYEAQLAERLTYGVGPDAPARLKISHYINTAAPFVALDWNDLALDETAYVLERSSNGGSSYSVIATLPADTEFYTDTTVAQNGSYIYRLKATNTIGSSAYGNTASVTLSDAEVPPAVTYQAENFSAQNGAGFRWDRHGFTGSGYVDINGSTTWIELEIDGGMGGPTPITFRYGGGETYDRPCAISINGVQKATSAFTSPGAWDAWDTETMVIDLDRGMNTLRIQPNGAVNGPNLDKIEVQASPVAYAAGEAAADTAALKAFDGDMNTFWKHHSPHGSWLQYAYGGPLEITHYQITSGAGALANDPKDWQFMGSNDDGATWTTLDSRSGVLFTGRKQTKAFTVSNAGDYALYRLEITAVQNIAAADSVQLAELAFTYGELPPLTPNPAAFAVAPHPVSETAIAMTAVIGTSVIGTVEYYFDEVSGNAGGTDSGWISTPEYTDSGLTSGTAYRYTVTMRDLPGNETTVSADMSATPFKISTIVWNGVGASDAQWTTGANWTGGIAPMMPEQYKKVVFNVSGAKECVLDTAAIVAQLVVGDNGMSPGLRLTDGAHLLAGYKPGKEPDWTAVGYNRSTKLAVESGAVFETAAHLLLGLEGTQSSSIEIVGGTVDVATSINMGNSANTATGTIIVDGGGVLRAGSLNINNSSSKVDLRNGTLILNGDHVGTINSYIAAGKIVTHATSTFDVDYNTIHPGKTTIISMPKLEGVLAHWSFDEAAAAGGAYADTSGSGNAIAVSTAPTHVTTGMKFGTGALDFDSSSSHYLTLAGSGGVGAMPLVSNSFTICFWAKRGSMGEHMVAGQGAPASGQGLHVGFRGDTHAKPNSPLLAFYANDLEYGAVVADTSDWHHYAMIFNANTMTKKIVIDGNVAGAVEVSSSYFAGGGANDFFIGRHYTGNYFDGLLDEVWVFDDVISDNRIISLYHSNSVSTPFSVWADSFLPADIGSLTNDYDNDSLNNLYEYALNGDPVDPEDGGVHPILSNRGGQLVYIHLRRNDDPGLVYSVETTTNLVFGDWMSADDTARGTNVMGGGTFFDEVTNSIPVDTDQQFIRLKITNP